MLQARLSILEYVNEKAEFKLLDPPTQGVLDERCGRGCIPFMEVCFAIQKIRRIDFFQMHDNILI